MVKVKESPEQFSNGVIYERNKKCALEDIDDCIDWLGEVKDMVEGITDANDMMKIRSKVMDAFTLVGSLNDNVRALYIRNNNL